MTDKPQLLDLFCGEGGATVGYLRAGFDVFGVDMDPKRLAYYPGAGNVSDAMEFVYAHGKGYDAIHASPPCQGYSIATSALPDRLERYDRMIPALRDLLEATGKPYVIENVYNARKEMVDPKLLCGRMFGLSAVDDDGTPLVMDRHRMFETNWNLEVPKHEKHDKTLQVAGSYGGARRDKVEARTVRKGGYVPPNLSVQQTLLGIDWMSEKGMWLSIPPVYSEYIGKQLKHRLDNAD